MSGKKTQKNKIGVLKQFGTGCWVCTCLFSSKSAHPYRQGPIQLAWKNASGLEQIFEENWSKNTDLTWTPYMFTCTPRGFSKFIYFSIFFIAFFLSHTYNLYLFLLYIAFQSFHLSRPLILKSFWVSTSLFKYILFHTFLKMFVFQINVS